MVSERKRGAMMRQPLRRVQIEVNGVQEEIGVYSDEAGWLTLVFYDQQANGVFDMPKEMAESLGRALIEVAND